MVRDLTQTKTIRSSNPILEAEVVKKMEGGTTTIKTNLSVCLIGEMGA